MTFSVTKSTLTSDLASLDAGAAAMKGAGKEVGLNGQVQDAAAAGDGAFAELFSALAGVFDSDSEAQTASAEDVAGSDAEGIHGKGEQNPENNDELLSRLAQSSQFLRGEKPSSQALDIAATEGDVGGNILPNAAAFSPLAGGSATVGSVVGGATVDSAAVDIESAEAELADGDALTDTESADAASDESTWVNSVAVAGGANANNAKPAAELSATDKSGLQGQMQTAQQKSELNPRLATYDGIAAELPVAAKAETSDPEQRIAEPGDAAAMIAAAGQPNSNPLAADNTDRSERLTDTAEEKTGANADPVSLTQSGPAKARQSQAADTLLNAGGAMSQSDAEQSSLEDSTLMTDSQDFSAVLDHVRGHEQTDPLSRTAKAQNLTAAEQQILDKRVNLHESRASSELNEKIAVMVNKDLQTATIRLDPAELGSMQIKLVIQNDQANVVIHTQNHHSRELLDQSMPRLREMLQQQGIALGDSQVQADSGGQQQSNYQQSSYAAGQKNSNNAENVVFDSHSESPVTTQYWQDSAKGVDFYA